MFYWIQALQGPVYLPGQGSVAYVWGINSAGDAVGEALYDPTSTGDPSAATGVLWSMAGGMSALPWSTPFRIFHAVNDSGAIVGDGDEGPLLVKSAHGSVSGSAITVLSLVGKDADAHGISNDGLICGTAGIPATEYGYIYNTAGPSVSFIEPLAGMSPHVPVVATAISLKGDAVVGKSGGHGFYYEPGGIVYKDLGPASRVTGLNASKAVVGSAYIGPTPDISEVPVLWNADEATPAPAQLPVIPGYVGGYANAINSSGTVVGTLWSAGDSSFIAFTYDGTSIKDLNSMVLNNQGWTLLSAEGINDSGLIIGNGDYGGQQMAFLLTPTTQRFQAPPRTIEWLILWVLGGVDVDGGGLTSHGPVPPFGPRLERQWSQLTPVQRDGRIGSVIDEIGMNLGSEAAREALIGQVRSRVDQLIASAAAGRTPSVIGTTGRKPRVRPVHRLSRRFERPDRKI